MHNRIVVFTDHKALVAKFARGRNYFEQRLGTSKEFANSDLWERFWHLGAQRRFKVDLFHVVSHPAVGDIAAGLCEGIPAAAYAGNAAADVFAGAVAGVAVIEEAEARRIHAGLVPNP